MASAATTATRRAARQLEAATARRDEGMRAMRAEGATYRQIAEAARLTHTGVRRILERRPAGNKSST
jgi:hypothetical protein